MATWSIQFRWLLITCMSAPPPPPRYSGGIYLIIHLVTNLLITAFIYCIDDILQVQRGQQVQVLYQENDWLYVIADHGREGFVPYTYCLPLERSVDDFALSQPAGKPSKSHLRDVSHSGMHGTNSKSMPDIASIGETSFDAGGDHKLIPVDGGRCHTSKKNRSNKAKPEGKKPTGVDNQGFIQTSTISESCPHSPDLLPSTSVDARISPSNSIVKPKALRPPTQALQRERSDSFKRATQSHSLSSKEASTSTLINQSQVPVHPKPSNSTTHTNSNTQYSSYSDFDTIKTSEHLINSSSENLMMPGPVRPFSKKLQGRFIVLFSFNALEENDVSVKRGEFVTLLNKDDPEWYWVLRPDGHEGFVPASFLCSAEGQITGKHVNKQCCYND